MRELPEEGQPSNGAAAKGAKDFPLNVAEVVTVRLIPITGGKSRFFVTAGKAVSPKAVERNKVKRRIRSIVRIFLRQHAGVSLLVNTRKGAAQKTFRELKTETIRALRKVV